MSNETSDAARLDALGFVEQTMYVNEDSPAGLTWRNSEVMDMLGEIAERLRVHDSERQCRIGPGFVCDAHPDGCPPSETPDQGGAE